MRGQGDQRRPMFFAIDIEDRIRPDHPLRPIKAAVDAILHQISPRFDAAYATRGRPSVPPEVLLRALLLQCLYTVRSERQLVERIVTDLLFRCPGSVLRAQPHPAGVRCDGASGGMHNRPRLDAHGITAAFFDAVVRRAVEAGLTSDEHFSVDGTLIESYASIKSFRPTPAPGSDQDEPDRDASSGGTSGDGGGSGGFKPRNPAVDFHGQKRSNATHRSTTDPEARLYRKGNGQPARLAHIGHTICENRHGLIMATHVSEAPRKAARPSAPRRWSCSTRCTNAGASSPRRWARTRATTAGPG